MRSGSILTAHQHREAADQRAASVGQCWLGAGGQVDRLRLEVGGQTLGAKLPSDPGVLEAAEWRTPLHGEPVDRVGAGANLAGDVEARVGVGKANEVISAIQKAIADAKKSLVTVPMVGSTIPHMITGVSDASRVMIKPASKGTGVIAGGAVRSVLELAGIHDILSKNLGASSPLNSARATINGLSRLRSAEEVASDRGKTVEEIMGKVQRA